MKDARFLVLYPHPTPERVMSGHSGHGLISRLILSFGTCQGGGMGITMAGDPSAGRDGSVTNPWSISLGLCKGS